MTHIKGYQLIKKLGEGGMATVYLAKEEGLDREVALKILTLRVSDEAFKKSFLSEARLVAKLEHPHIIKVYRVNVEANQLYMEMELLRGGTLKERLEKSALGIPTILSIIQQIASALYYAHNQGYIHRDIKPANILFRDDDEAVLTDFGIAKLEDGDSDLTLAGHSGFGTPNYMAPEQAIGEKVDYRVDMYSLGIVLYEMLAGNKPFKAASTGAIIHKHMTAEIPPLPEMYAYLQPILDKVLAKNKEERYTDMQAFSEALMSASPSDSTKDVTVPYFNHDNTAPYINPHANNNQTIGAQTQSTYTHGNVTKPWNIHGQVSSTVLVISFIDIVDSTKLSNKYGDVVYSRDVRQNFERIIKEHMQDVNEGMLIKFLGDGVMLIYSDPVYAIENSLRIQKSVKQFLVDSKTPKFLLRIGLNIGGVTLENVSNLDVQGIHVNKAQRIEGQCQPGLVALSRSVYDMAYPRLQHQKLFWLDIGDKKLKGIPDKERVYLVSEHKIHSKRYNVALYGLYGVLGIGLSVGGYVAYTKYSGSDTNVLPAKPVEVAKPESTVAVQPQKAPQSEPKIPAQPPEIEKLTAICNEFEQDKSVLSELEKAIDTAAEKHPDHEQVKQAKQDVDAYKWQQEEQKKERLLAELSPINITSSKETAKAGVAELNQMPEITISVKHKAYIHCLYQSPSSSQEKAMMRLYPLPKVFVQHIPALKKYKSYKKRNSIKMPIGDEFSGVAKVHCFTTTKGIKEEYSALFKNKAGKPLLKHTQSLDEVRASIAEFTDGIYKETTFEQVFK